MEIYYKYEENPFIVNLATRESPIYTIPFPAVTVCPVAKTERNFFNFTEAVHKLWDNESLTQQEMKSTQYLSLLCDNIDHTYREKLNLNATFSAEKFYEHLDNLKPLQSAVFFMCYFMGKEVECEDLFVPIVLDDGICYTFNMLNREDLFKEDVVHYTNFHQNQNHTNWTIDGGYPSGIGRNVYPKRALLAGADSGLEIYLMQNVEESDYLCFRDMQGFNVVLHTPHTIPQLKKHYLGVPFDTAVQAIVQPKMMTTSKEVKGYRPSDRLCFFADERSLKYFEIYNPENCALECLTNHTLKMCRCVNFYMPRTNSTDICGNAKKNCMDDALYEMKEKELRSLLGESGDMDSACNCLPLCTELTYDIETARNFLPWRDQFRAEKRINELFELLGVNLSTIHLSKLSVYFSRDQFLTSQRNELYGPFDFLANFGGLLGLFTGFSLLSGVEIIYYLSVRWFCNTRLYNDFAGP
ncbi:hypothetical protein JTB14_020373 [Gonioctena quinquepunctata]|nr:hypothetical protein JTB14_020373 [Gonioctena quinquepunctata]